MLFMQLCFVIATILVASNVTGPSCLGGSGTSRLSLKLFSSLFCASKLLHNKITVKISKHTNLVLLQGREFREQNRLYTRTRGRKDSLVPIRRFSIDLSMKKINTCTQSTPK